MIELVHSNNIYILQKEIEIKSSESIETPSKLLVSASVCVIDVIIEILLS